MHFRPSRPVRTLAVTLLIALQLILQPAAVLAAVTGAGGPMGMAGDCSGCCSAPASAVEQASGCCSAPVPVENAGGGCCCHGPKTKRIQSASDAPSRMPSDEGIAFKRGCNCAAPPGSVPLAPRVSFEGTAAAGAGEYWAPLIALPGVIEVERFGVHGIARARAPGALRGLNVLHQVYRI